MLRNTSQNGIGESVEYLGTPGLKIEINQQQIDKSSNWRKELK